MSKSELKRKKAEKSKVGMGRRVTSLSSLGEIFELDHPDWAKHKSGGTLRVERDGKMHYDPQNKPLLPFGKKSRDFKSRKKAFREAYIANKRDNHILATKRGIARAKANREMEAKDELLELDSKAGQRYVNYHRGKMHRTYAKDRGRNQAKKAGVGAALGGIAGGILGGRRGFRKGLKGAATGVAIGGFAGLGSPTRGSTKNKMIEDVKRRAKKEHIVRAYGQQAQRKGHSFYINPKYNKKTYA